MCVCVCVCVTTHFRRLPHFCSFNMCQSITIPIPMRFFVPPVFVCVVYIFYNALLVIREFQMSAHGGSKGPKMLILYLMLVSFLCTVMSLISFVVAQVILPGNTVAVTAFLITNVFDKSLSFLLSLIVFKKLLNMSGIRSKLTAITSSVSRPKSKKMDSSKTTIMELADTLSQNHSMKPSIEKAEPCLPAA